MPPRRKPRANHGRSHPPHRRYLWQAGIHGASTASLLMCAGVVVFCSLMGRDVQRLLRRAAGPVREGQTTKDDDDDLRMGYYLALEDREKARVYNMTSKQAYDDLNTSYSLQLAHIGVMFFFTLCVLFTLLNLDVFEGLFGGGAPGGVVDTTVYATK